MDENRAEPRKTDEGAPSGGVGANRTAIVRELYGDEVRATGANDYELSHD